MVSKLSCRPFNALAVKYKSYVDTAAMEKLWLLCMLAIIFPVFTSLLHLDDYRIYRLGMLGCACCAYLILLSKIYIWDNHTLGKLLTITLVLAAISLGVLKSGMRMYLNTFLLVLSAEKMCFRKISRYCFRFFVLSFVVCFALYFAGITGDGILVRGNGVVRHGYGFGHPNSLGFWCMLMVFSALLAFSSRNWFARFAAPWVLLVWAYYTTDSRAAILASAFALLACGFLTAAKPKIRRPELCIGTACAATLIMFASIILLCLLYRSDVSWLKMMNKLFSGRLNLSRKAFSEFGVTLFGTKSEAAYPVDIFFVFSMIRSGVIPTLLYMGLVLYSLQRAGREGQWDILIVGVAAMLYCCMESSLMNPVNLALYACCAELNNQSQ